MSKLLKDIANSSGEAMYPLKHPERSLAYKSILLSLPLPLPLPLAFLLYPLILLPFYVCAGLACSVDIEFLRERLAKKGSQLVLKKTDGISEHDHVV
mmetsp:Transcript_24054/g.33915  ORF Transcript_24054/g.33915 Transcript_24054/m.33915 type:complete len:97 (-) Transcript_24054:127-417(-)